MKTKLCALFFMFLLLLLSACSGGENLPERKPYSLKLGTYEFETATLTNIFTEEVEEKTSDELISDSSEECVKWKFLGNFSVTIKKDTEFIYTKDNRCVVLKGGLAFELIAEDTLQVHLSAWRTYDLELYDIVIVLAWGPRYC